MIVGCTIPAGDFPTLRVRVWRVSRVWTLSILANHAEIVELARVSKLGWVAVLDRSKWVEM